MIITRDFSPITIKLETKEEVSILSGILKAYQLQTQDLSVGGWIHLDKAAMTFTRELLGRIQ